MNSWADEEERNIISPGECRMVSRVGHSYRCCVGMMMLEAFLHWPFFSLSICLWQRNERMLCSLCMYVCVHYFLCLVCVCVCVM